MGNGNSKQSSKTPGPTTFECAVCTYELTEVKPHIADGTPVCKECTVESIVPLFHAALAKEANWPPPWGDAILEPGAFLDVLGQDFATKYRKRELQYEIKLKNRRYCKHLKRTEEGNEEPCGAFLTRRPWKPKKYFECDECGGRSCRECEEPITKRKKDKHDCKGFPEEPKDNDLDGLIRGKDYQLCPDPECGLRVNLLTGCNSMLCKQRACRTQFCYICGQKAKHGSDHWQQGNPCPRWNQPGEKARFDRAPNPYRDLPSVFFSDPPDADGRRKLMIKWDAMRGYLLDYVTPNDMKIDDIIPLQHDPLVNVVQGYIMSYVEVDLAEKAVATVSQVRVRTHQEGQELLLRARGRVVSQFWQEDQERYCRFLEYVLQREEAPLRPVN